MFLGEFTSIFLDPNGDLDESLMTLSGDLGGVTLPWPLLLGDDSTEVLVCEMNNFFTRSLSFVDSLKDLLTTAEKDSLTD